MNYYELNNFFKPILFQNLTSISIKIAFLSNERKNKGEQLEFLSSVYIMI